MSGRKTVTHLRRGVAARVVGYASDLIPIKIYEMGLLPGVVVIKQQQLPFNGPIRLKLEGNPNAIALRASEARLILIEENLK